MPLDLVDYEGKTQKAVKAFWKSRNSAKKKQQATGKADQGERGSVTSGKNMDAFMDMILPVVRANGLEEADEGTALYSSFRYRLSENCIENWGFSILV